jgi:hypothetical protein
MPSAISPLEIILFALSPTVENLKFLTQVLRMNKLLKGPDLCCRCGFIFDNFLHFSWGMPHKKRFLTLQFNVGKGSEFKLLADLIPA